ncbi:uncharacterized protein C8Q71DRAFT_860718 [Rhodofomes roseus]|uniref:N-acetyltransferase domain-containing protein n=1 Tax=Rhodofomes roseus TaxID=34475 RepID=A0ABQ8K6R7_9APHY|nr:uncharacterized protein C8Q71DRAFT_860718 [Rhodofomes roseus]KAH9832947.1 hypothetical protein C8Q71DRAFT_860718 [Rhodofomes roseus]
MPNTSGLRVVCFASAQEFVHAVEPFDDPFMNFGLGTVMDTGSLPSSTASKYADAGDSNAGGTVHNPMERSFVAAFEGERLILTATYTTKPPPCILSYPTTTSPSPSPQDAVAALLAAWPNLRTSPPSFTATACFATLDTLRSAVHPTPRVEEDVEYHYKICFAEPEDAQPLVALVLALSAHSPGPMRPSHAILSTLQKAIATRTVYVVHTDQRLRGDPEPNQHTKEHRGLMGFLLLERITPPHTVAIRNVFVVPEHRRRGLAETLVRAVTQACLGLPVESAQGPANVEVEVGTPG